ncbi:MAG: hypothetical protein ACK5QS_02645 [Pseudanabaenaceae cyanobacterium]
MANTQIRNLLTEINALLQRPPQMANGADQVLASEEWQYREQLKQLRSRLEAMTDDSQIDALEQKFRALVHQLQPLQAPAPQVSDPNVIPLPAVPPLPPLKSRDQRDISRPMPLPPLSPVGGNTGPSRPQPANEPNPSETDTNELDTSEPGVMSDQSPRESIIATTDFSQPLPLPPNLKAPLNLPPNVSSPRHSGRAVVAHSASVGAEAAPDVVTGTLTGSVTGPVRGEVNLTETNPPEEDITADLGPSVNDGGSTQELEDQQLVDVAGSAGFEPKSPTPEITLPVGTAAVGSSLEPQLLALLEQVVQKSVQQAVQQSLNTERAVILNEISQTIAQNITQNTPPTPEVSPAAVSNPRYERLEEEIANLKLQKELLNQEISRLANAQESWSSQVATMQAQQKEGLQKSLESAVQEAVQSAMQSVVQDTLEQTIEQALQSKSQLQSQGKSNLVEPLADAPNEVITPIAPELVSQVQQQTDRFLLNLDAMFNATFQNLEHDLEGYKAAFEKKLSYIEQLEHRGEALLESIIAKVDSGESAAVNSSKDVRPAFNESGVIDLPPEIDPSYLSPVQEYVDESLIERLLSIDNEPTSDPVQASDSDDSSIDAELHHLSDVLAESEIVPPHYSASMEIVESEWLEVTEDATSTAEPQDPTVAEGNSLNLEVPQDTAQILDLEPSHETSTIEDLLTLFPEDELFATIDEASPIVTKIDGHDLAQWQEIYADDVTIAADTRSYHLRDRDTDEHLVSDLVPDLNHLNQPEIDLDRDVLSHLSNLAQMLEEVENTSTVIPVTEESFGFEPIPDGLAVDDLEEDLLNLINGDQETVASSAELPKIDLSQGGFDQGEDDVTLIASSMLNLPPLPPMTKFSTYQGDSRADSGDDDNLQKFDIPPAGATGGNAAGGSGDLRASITELKVPNLTEVTADDELLSWLNDNPLSDKQLSDTDDLISQSVNSESVTILDQPISDRRSQPATISNLQPLPLPILPSLPETIIQEVTELSTQADTPVTQPQQNKTANKNINEVLDEDLFNIEDLGNEDESLILLPNSKGIERQEVVPWDDSLIRELAEDLSNLGEGGGANPLVATNIDQVIRNTPFRHTQPSMTTAKGEPSPELPLSESQPIPRRREPLNQSDNMAGFLVTDQDDPDQLFAAVIAEQIAIRSLSDDTTEAVDELDALLSGKTTSISNPVNYPSSHASSSTFAPPPHQEVILEDSVVTPFDGDTSQLFQNLEADVADLFPESLTKSESGIEDLDHGAVFHDLTSDLDDLSQALRGTSHSAQGIEQLLELADLDSEATYIITDDASTVLEPNRPQPDNKGGQEHQDHVEQDNLELDAETALITDLGDAKDIDFDEVLSALDEIEKLDTGSNPITSSASSTSSADDDNSWQRELDQLASLTPITSIADYVKPVVEEEEPLSSADFFASLEREAAEEEAAAQLNAFANRAEHFATPTLQRPQPEVALPEILDPMEQRLTALADATERGEAEDKLWQSLFDEIERPNFSEPLLGIEREKLGLSATATDRQGALDILAETVESRSQALVPPPPDHEVYGLHDQWILGIDVGAYHLRASLCNGNSGKFYPLSFKLGSKLNPEETEIADGFSFMASYSGELTLQDPLTETIAIGRTTQELPESGYGLTNWKSLFNLGLPYKSITSWQPVVQWSDQHQVPLRWLIAATVTALKQLPQMAHHPRLPDVAEIFNNLQGVVVAQPSADADTFALNIREAILAAGLVPNPEQVMVVEQSIAPLLRQVQVQVKGQVKGQIQEQGQSNSLEGISLFLDAGATGTSVGLLKGIPLAPTKHDLCHRHWDYGGNSLDQDIVLQLLYPHWRMVSNPERDQCDLSDLNLPAAGSIAIPERAILGQRLRSSAVGLELLAQAKHLKESLTNDPDQERWQAEIHGLPLVVLRRELESLVFQPYIQQINRELNTLLSLSGIFGADITKVYLIGGAWQFPLVLRWLQQKLPNAQVENLAPTAIAEGLAVAPLHPHLLNLARQQYSDYFLLREICHLQLSDAVNPNSLLHQLQLQGINIKACRDRILTILQGDFPRGLFPWQEPEGCLVQNDPSLQSELFSGNLFELNSDGTYQPNVAKFQQLRAYLEVILCNMRQTLTEPMVFPPLTTPAAPTP